MVKGRDGEGQGMVRGFLWQGESTAAGQMCRGVGVVCGGVWMCVRLSGLVCVKHRVPSPHVVV